jgi:hypothetical protein
VARHRCTCGGEQPEQDSKLENGAETDFCEEFSSPETSRFRYSAGPRDAGGKVNMSGDKTIPKPETRRQRWRTGFQISRFLIIHHPIQTERLPKI